MDLERGRQLLSRGRYVTVLREAVAAAETAEGSARADHLLLAARAAQQLGLTHETVRLATDALAGEGLTPDLTARALSAMGAALLHRGDPGEAEVYLLQAAAGPAAPLTAADVQYNLAQVYEMMRRPDPAAASYRLAADAYAALHMPADELRARQSLTWVLLELGDVQGARVELQRSEILVTPNSREQAQQLALEAYAVRLAGQGAEAVRLCEDLLAPGHPGATAWCRCYAAWLVADVAADEGRPELAGEFLARARRDAESARDPALWNRLTALQNRIDGM